jgi:hypothetical protein
MASNRKKGWKPQATAKRQAELRRQRKDRATLRKLGPDGQRRMYDALYKPLDVDRPPARGEQMTLEDSVHGGLPEPVTDAEEPVGPTRGGSDRRATGSLPKKRQPGDPDAVAEHAGRLSATLAQFVEEDEAA